MLKYIPLSDNLRKQEVVTDKQLNKHKQTKQSKSDTPEDARK